MDTYKQQKVMPKIINKKRGYEPGRQPNAKVIGSTYGKDDRYHTMEWRMLRATILEREPLCRACGDAGRVELAKVVDHIHPVTDGGKFFDELNLQPLCTSCHNSKSAKEGNNKWKSQKEQ
jgi:5-methylcytosine-specific restriction protein A